MLDNRAVMVKNALLPIFLLLTLSCCLASGLVGCGNVDQQYDEFLDDRQAELENEANKPEPPISDDVLQWILLLLDLALLVWIVFFDGAEWLEGSAFVLLFFHHWAVKWPASGIRMFAGFSLAGAAIYLVLLLLRVVNI